MGTYAAQRERDRSFRYDPVGTVKGSTASAESKSRASLPLRNEDADAPHVQRSTGGERNGSYARRSFQVPR
jgi:hypothetical protein